MRRRAAGLTVAMIAGVAVAGAAVWVLWPRDAAQSGPRAASAIGAVSAEQATTRAQQLLDDHVKDCTRHAAQPPPSCGIRIPWAAEFDAVDEIRYRIERTPAVTLTLPTFRADDGILIATVTGTGPDGATKTATYRTDNWMLRGDVAVKHSGVALSPW